MQRAEPVKGAICPAVQDSEPADLLWRQRPGLQRDHPTAQRRPASGFDVAGNNMGRYADLAQLSTRSQARLVRSQAAERRTTVGGCCHGADDAVEGSERWP